MNDNHTIVTLKKVEGRTIKSGGLWIFNNEIDTIVVGKPLNMNGTATERVEVTNKFIHKLKCKYNKLKIDTMDVRLTTVEAHRTMNDLNINPRKKKNLVDTISAVYILEMYMNKNK